jgi:hypothetical protein
VVGLAAAEVQQQSAAELEAEQAGLAEQARALAAQAEELGSREAALAARCDGLPLTGISLGNGVFLS